MRRALVRYSISTNGYVTIKFPSSLKPLGRMADASSSHPAFGTLTMSTTVPTSSSSAMGRWVLGVITMGAWEKTGMPYGTRLNPAGETDRPLTMGKILDFLDSTIGGIEK